MIDRKRPPEPGSVRPFSFPEFTSTTLNSGLRVVLAPRTRIPLALLRLVLPAGAEHDTRETAGLAALTASLLDEGTTTRSSFELAAAAERIGGYLSTNAGWNSALAEALMLGRDLRTGLDLIADVAMRPTFPAAEIVRLKQQTVAHLRRRRMQPATAAVEAFNRALYGNTPYSRPILGTEEALEEIDRDRITRFFRERVLPGGATLIAVGDFEPDVLESLASRSFASWQGRAQDHEPPDAPAAASENRVFLVDRPDAPQAEICMGHAGLARRDPDFLTFSVMNVLLGGKFTSRINLNLRERHGYTYGAHSSVSARRGPGPFIVTAAVDNDAVVPAVSEVLSELERLRQDRVSPRELRETVDYIIGSFPYSCETLTEVGSRLGTIAVHGLPKDYYRDLPRALREVSVDDILRCARAHVHPERALIAVAGPADAIASPLADIGPVERAERA